MCGRFVYLSLVFAVATASAADEPAVTAPAVRIIEGNIVMPTGAEPLANYDRYYKRLWTSEAIFVGVRMIRRNTSTVRPQVRVTAVPGVPNAFVVHGDDPLPDFNDAGCSVVNVIIAAKDWKPIRVQRIRDGKWVLAACNP